MDRIMVANPANSFLTARRNALENSLMAKRATRLDKQDKFEDEKRLRTRKAWTIEDRDREVMSKIDLVKPYVMNKEAIAKLSPDKQAQILEYYAKNDKRERERHKEFGKFSMQLGKEYLPMVKGPESYALARQTIIDRARKSGLATEEEIKNQLEPAFPEEYNPEWVKSRLSFYGYKQPQPDYRTLSPGSQLYKDGKLIATAPAKPVKEDKPPTTEKSLSEIAKARSRIAELSMTGGMDSMAILTMALTGDREELKRDMQAAKVSRETKDAILAQKDIIDYYAQFIDNSGVQQKAEQQQKTAVQQQDPQAVYNELRDSGASHEQAVAKMQEMGF